MPVTVTREGNEAVIRIPIDEVLGMRVALAPCPCRATKSTATSTIRTDFEKALARVLFRKSTPQK